MMARLIPTARAMSSICASRTPRASNRARVASRISFSRARLRTAAAERRPSVLGCMRGSVLMSPCYVPCNREWHDRLQVALAVKSPDGVDRVGLVRALVVAVAQDPGEAEGHAARVAR